MPGWVIPIIIGVILIGILFVVIVIKIIKNFNDSNRTTAEKNRLEIAKIQKEEQKYEKRS